MPVKPKCDCGTCKNCYERKRRAQFPEERREANRKWRLSKSPEFHFDRQLIYKYGITIDHYYQMLDDQAGRCAICKTISPGNKKKFFCVDHNHETGEVRGLLCDDCNIALGKFKDDRRLLLAAWRYLNERKI